MTIQFTCGYCGKKVSAPDSAGGKQGKCPGCQKVVFIPSTNADELLDIAPLDEQAERRQRELAEKALREGHDFYAAQSRVGEEEAGKTDDKPVFDKSTDGGLMLPPDALDLRGLIVSYISNMATGKLNEAQADAKQLRSDTKAAQTAMAKFAADSVRDPRIASVPPPVVAGFLKQLQAQLK